MEFQMRNIGILRKADIRLDAVTVIAGANSTGKSTVGKALYAVVNGLYEITPLKLFIKKIDSLDMELFRVVRRFESDYNTKKVLRNFELTLDEYRKKINEFRYFMVRDDEIELLHNEFVLDLSRQMKILKEQEITYEITDIFYSNDEFSKEEFTFNRHILRIESILRSSIVNKELKLNVIQNVFESEFSGQICNLTSDECEGEIKFIEINDNSMELKFTDNKVDVNKSKVNINRDFSVPIYIDNPLILDELVNDRRGFFVTEPMQYNHIQSLIKLLLNNKKASLDIFLNEETRNRIESIFKSVIKGSLNIDGSKSHYKISKHEGFQKLSLTNLSTGMKAFSILSILKDSGTLENTEYVILDEPEIHLHPEWQLKYAQLIILLSFNFNIKFLITSHSPYFIEAIELYSKLYGIDSEVKYYMSVLDNDENTAVIEDYTHNLSIIYDHLAYPMYDLAELRDKVLDEGAIGDNECVCNEGRNSK